MGLRIEPGGAAWSYGGFSRFRERLAALEGIDLNKMRGFGGKREWETVSGLPITLLEPLLNHSDCEGYLDAYECDQMIPRLQAIASTPDALDDEYDREQLRRLIAGFEHVVKHGCSVRFS